MKVKVMNCRGYADWPGNPACLFNEKSKHFFPVFVLLPYQEKIFLPFCLLTLLMSKFDAGSTFGQSPK